MAVECCDASGKPVAIDASHAAVPPEVRAILIDALKNAQPPRLYGRVAVSDIAHLGVDCQKFCEEAHKLLQPPQPYSVERLRSKMRPSLRFLLPNPPIQGLMCTDVVIRCLPD